MGKPLRLLIVEDSKDDAQIMLRQLKQGGYDPEYERVETAEAMKSALGKKGWDVIICDYHLPQFDAPAAVALLKATGLDIPIIIMSGAVGEEMAVAAMRAGAHDYVMKDKPARLIPAIEREIKEAEARSQRREVEKQFRESETRFSQVFQNAPMPIAIGTLEEGRILYVNEQTLKFIEFSREEMVGHTVAELNLWVDPQEHKKALDDLSKNREGIFSYPLSLRTKSGAIKDVLFSIDVIIFSNVPHFLSSLIDITERKRAEESVRRAQRQWQETFDAMNDAVCLLDMEGRILRCNHSLSALTGRPAGELTGAACYSVIHGTTAPPPDCPMPRMMQSRKSEKLVFQPGDRWLEVKVEPMFDEEGRISGAVHIIADITDRRKKELELRRWEHIFQNAQWGIAVSSGEGQIMDAVNPAFATMHGYDHPDELVGRSIEEIYTPESRLELAENIQRSQEKGHDTFEAWHLRKDGSRFPVLLDTTTVKDEQGQFLYRVVNCNDITERREMEEDKARGVERLRKGLNATVQAIAQVVETRDPYTAGHQRRVADLSRAIAEEMGLTGERIEGLRMAALIHDLGKIGIPSDLLSKPLKLSAVEFNLVQVHAQAGYDILKDIDFPGPVAEIVLQHHERMDGSGYPQGLKGEAILERARILAVADTVEAMASHRPYRPALGLAAALKEIEAGRGRLYDAAIVDACLRVFREKGYRFV